MAIEKDTYGFRIDSWNSKIAATGQETFERLTNGEMAALVGCTEGSASNYRKTVSEVTGWTMVATGKRSGSENSDNGDKPAAKRTNGKRKGCFPAKLDASLNKALGCTDDDSPDWIRDPTWSDFVRARSIQGENWVSFISKKVKEKELSEFALWIASNDAADAAENAATAAQQKAFSDAVTVIESNGGRVVMLSGYESASRELTAFYCAD